MKFFTKILKRKVIIPVAVLVVAGIAYVALRKSPSGAGTVEVKRGDIVEAVRAIGKVKAVQDLDLAFERTGTIARVNVKVGDWVEVGQTLVILSNGDLEANVEEAEANVKAEEAKLSQLKNGTRPEELDVEKVKVKNAEVALDDAKNNLIETIRDAYTKADDAVRRRADQFFSNPRTPAASLSFPADFQLKLNIESARVNMESAFTNWAGDISSLNTGSDFAVAITSSKNKLIAVKSFLDTASLAVNGLQASSNISQTTIDAWKADVTTGRTNVNTALAGITTAQEKFRTAGSNLDLARQEYALKKAGATPEDVAAEEAALERAQASVKDAKAQLSKSVLRAPIKGIITKVDAKTGEVAALNARAVSLESHGAFEIESNVPEINIGEVLRDNLVSITLDAFPGEMFDGKVAAVDPAETIVDGVVNFKVTIVFNKEEPRLKSGLTANVHIETGRKPGVLILPHYTLIESDKGTSVRKIANNSSREIPVVIGAHGEDGMVEIVSGLSEGDWVENIGLAKTQ